MAVPHYLTDPLCIPHISQQIATACEARRGKFQWLGTEAKPHPSIDMDQSDAALRFPTIEMLELIWHVKRSCLKRLLIGLEQSTRNNNTF